MLKKLTRVAVAMAVVTAMALPAAAQNPTTLTLKDYGSNAFGGYLLSPYKGYLGNTNPGSSGWLDFFCVDFNNYAPNLGATTTYYTSALTGGDLSTTRYNDATYYKKVGWLVQKYFTNSANWSGIQTAIWALSKQKGYGTYSGVPWDNSSMGTNYWINQANANYASGSYDNLVILSSAGSAGVAYGGKQEYMMVTPEPETYALLAGGLLLLFVAYRRRQNNMAGALGV